MLRGTKDYARVNLELMACEYRRAIVRLGVVAL
jgi:hypothetical protein